VENIQMGHDSVELLERCAAEWDAASQVLDSTELVPADIGGPGGDRGIVLSYLEPGRNVGSVLPEIPLEPVHARALLGQMLEEGLVTVGAEPPDDEDEEGEGDDDVSEESMVLDDAVAAEEPATEVIEPRISAHAETTAETEIVQRPRPVRRLGD